MEHILKLLCQVFNVNTALLVLIGDNRSYIW